MYSASEYIEQALALGMEELAALQQGDIDTASDIAGKRDYYTSLAWTASMDVPHEDFRKQVVKLHSLQETLIHEASRIKELLRESLCNSHREQRRMSAYRQAVSHAM